MTHILHLDASARGGASHSRTISGEIIRAKNADPTAAVTYRDLGHQDIPYVSEPLCLQHPMYNFSVPCVFKSYIDQVARAGETFNPATYEGLLNDNKAVVITTRGGGYGPGEAREAYNVQDPTVKNVFGFMGVTDLEFIHVNNTAGGDDMVNGALAEARAKIAPLVQAT